jgi:hypothetical protein
MKTLLPILKTKLTTLSFLFVSTLIIATTVPQVRNFFAPQEKIGEKITTEQKKIAHKINKQKRTLSSLRANSSITLDINKSLDPTIDTDQEDYYPGDIVTITGTNWQPDEVVTLVIESDCGCTHEVYEETADAFGNITNNDFEVMEWHLGASFTLTATGNMGGYAETTFTDSPRLDDVDPITQIGSACANSPTTLTFEFTVNRGPGANSNGSVNNVGINISGLPVGVTVNSGLPITVDIESSGYSGSFTLAVANSVTAGSYDFTLTADGPGNDDATGTGTLVVSQVPNAPAAGTVTVCYDGNPHTGTATAGAGESIVWYTTDAGATTTSAPSRTAAGSSSAYAAAKNNTTNCESATRTLVTVTIYDLPIVTCPSSFAVCENDVPFALTGGAPAGGSYSGTGVSAGNFDPDAAGTGPHTITYTYSDGNTCSNSCSFTITVNASPTAPTANATQTFCSVEAPTIGDLVATGNDLKWYAESSGGSPLPGSTILLNGENYFVSQTSAEGCESARTEVDVVINTTPGVPTADATQTFCSADAPTVADLTATGINLKWYAESSGGSPLAGGTALVNGENYFVSQTSAEGCESARTEVDVVINTTPGAPTGNASQTFCAGATLADVLVTGNNIVWYNAAAPGGSVLPANTVLVNGTTYYASQTTTNCESVTRLAVTITVNPLPNNAAEGTPGFSGSTICFGETGTLTFDALTSGFVAPYTIEYTDGVTTWSQLIASASATTFNAAVNPTSTTNYTLVSITNGNNCVRTSGFGDDAARITVRPLPLDKTVSAQVSAVCYNTGTNIQVLSSESGVSYQLRNDADNSNIGSAVIGNGGTIDLPTGNLSTTTTFNVLATKTTASPTTNCTREMSNTPTVVVDNIPTITTFNTCLGNNNMTFTQTGGTAGGTWSVSGGGTVNAATGEFNETTAGCFTVTYTTPNAGCSDTKSFYVAPHPPPAPTVPNTCNTNLVATGVTATGLTTQYRFDGGSWTTSNTSPNATPGCHTVQVRFVLNEACGTLNAGDQAPCGISPVKSAVIFPAAPVLSAISNTCNTKLADIEAVANVDGFTAEYAVKAPGGSYSSFGTLAAANALLDATPGCWSVKARYKITSACGTTNAGATGTGACGESNEVNAVVFPAKPVVAPISNTCNTKLADITAVTPVAGFTAQYAVKAPGAPDFSSFGTLAAANAALANIPGCWSVKAQYVLNGACGTSTPDGAYSTGACGESDVVSAVVFPAPPIITAPANTCNAAFSLPTVAPVSGFGVEYNINYNGWYASPTIPTSPACYTIHARYVLSQACGLTTAGSDGPLTPCDDEEGDCPVAIGGCTVSLPVNVVIFPATPAAPVVSNTCNAALTIPVLNAVTGFTAQYSFDNGGNWSTSNVSASTTPACYSMKTRYVANQCGTIAANTLPPAACAASATGYAVIFPAKPSAPVVSNTCNTALTIPALDDVAGFTRQYSFDGTSWGTSNTSSTTPACYTLKSRYIWTGSCGAIAVNTEAPCGSSDAGNAVIFPTAPVITAPSNTCATAFSLPYVASVTGFTKEYSIDGGSFATSPTIPTAPGNYSVKARYVLTSVCGSTSAGTAGTGLCGESNTVNVTINPLPAISTAAQAATVCSGSAATINVTGLLAGSTNNITYNINGGSDQTANGVIANGSGEGSFTTGNLTYANNGQNLTITSITVTSSDPDCTVGSLSVVAELSVYEPTSVTISSNKTDVDLPLAGIQHQWVYGCESATLTAVPDGEGPFTYQWYRNGVLIPGATNITYTVPELIGVGTHNYTVTADGYCGGPVESSSAVTVTIEAQEADAANDGDAYYTGPSVAFTANTTSNTATFTMSAFIQNSDDDNCGDIATARLSFWYKVAGTSTWIKVPNGQNLPVSYVNPQIPSMGGTAAVIAQLNIGNATCELFDVMVTISGNYTGQNVYACSQVSITKPQPGGTISGEAKLKYDNSVGFVDAHRRTNLGFFVNYTLKGGKPQNPKGKVNLTVKSYNDRYGNPTSTIHMYKITSNAIASMNIVGNKATFTSKANISEILSTDPLELSPIEGNCTMVMDLEDVSACTNNSSDKVGIVVHRNNGGMWYANNYTTLGVVSPEAIYSGCIYVSGSTLPACSAPGTTINAITNAGAMEATTPELRSFNVKVFPNPSEHQFSLYLEGASNDKVHIVVYDMMGRRVKMFEKVSANVPIHFGMDLKVGTYIVEVKQGSNRKTLKVIKQ